jgi:hypothetical protein
MNPAERILETLERHLQGPAHIRLLGGAALILGYGLNRATEDADLLADDREIDRLVSEADFASALEATNRELEPEGLYISHIWGPEQQILTTDWRSSCRAIDRTWGTGNLSVSVLGPLDLILSKLCRADEEDLEDIRHVIRVEQLTRAHLRDAMDRALVPEVFRDVFAENCRKVLRLCQT